MSEYDRIDVSEGTDINRPNSLRQGIIFHYLCFSTWLMKKTMSFNGIELFLLNKMFPEFIFGI